MIQGNSFDFESGTPAFDVQLCLGFALAAVGDKHLHALYKPDGRACWMLVCSYGTASKVAVPPQWLDRCNPGILPTLWDT